MVTLSFCEFSIKVTEGILKGALYRLAQRAICIKKPTRMLPCLSDDLVEAMAGKEEESVVSARRVECPEFGRTRTRYVDYRDSRHASSWHRRWGAFSIRLEAGWWPVESLM